MSAFNPSLSCPHCNAPIHGGLVKGLGAIKQCPSCQKKIKFKKPPASVILKLLWKPFVIFMVIVVLVLAVSLALFGDVPEMLVPVVTVLFMLFTLPKINKLSSFEKDE